MKLNPSKEKNQTRQSLWLGLLVVLVAALTLEATALIQYFYSRKGLRQEASQRAESQLEAMEYRIMDIIDQAEAAVRNKVWIAQWCLSVPDSIRRVTERIVNDNPVVMGSVMAMVPGYFKNQPLMAPYTSRSHITGEVSALSLATDEYNYPSKDWFTKPLETGEGYWSEPYIDIGGGNILMTTYSLPVRDKTGSIAAILTADISLEWLTDAVGNIKVYPDAYSLLLSRQGKIMACPEKSLVMNKSLQEVTSTMGDTALFNRVGRTLLSGEEGNMSIHYKGAVNHIYFSPMERTGWSMSIVIPDKDIYGGLRRIGNLVTIMQLLGLAMLLLILFAFFRRQVKFNQLEDKRKRMMNELHVASNIQMSMIPKEFPPFPERTDIDMAADIVPAKEVGGDLYDFFIRDEKLFFCIGDVSGKGVPASLVMAVTRSLFRTLAAHEYSPKRIVTAMNSSMSDMNDSNMFVTLFCGVLDMKTGHLRYCNAGHNAPFILTDHIWKLDVLPNLPLGIVPDMTFEEQSMDIHYDDSLFLYTDGITEAENSGHELFGEERLEKVLHGRRPAINHLKDMQKAVSDFVGDAPQSDDITMLFIHYLNQVPTDVSERHLVLKNDIQEISRLAQFLDTLAAEKGLDHSLTMSLNLALEEAVTNVILYAYPKGVTGLIELDAFLEKDTLRFVLSDRGVAFDPTAAPEADTTLSVEDRPIGGLGIYLVRKTMDQVTYRNEDGKNILSMIKKI